MSWLRCTNLGVFVMWFACAPYAARAEAVDSPRVPVAASIPSLPSPAAWQPSRGRECNHGGKYRGFCDGPRKVAAPTGAAGQLGEQLGLGTRRAASQLLVGSPDPEWIAHAPAPGSANLVWPVDEGKFWRGFGQIRRGPARKKGHAGIDVGALEGSAIRAVQSGIVAYADNELNGYGNVLMVVHGDGSVALYAHCQAIFVFAGQTVEQGQIVALVGHTGIARGTHLHFEYRRGGHPKDPLPLFKDPPQSALATLPRKARKNLEGSSRQAPPHSSAKSMASPRLLHATAPADGSKGQKTAMASPD